MDHSNKLTRREALKALAAASGAVLAGAALPDKWAKPVVGSGVLPAHAQASRIFVIEKCEFYFSDSFPVACMAWISPVEKDISLTCEWTYQPYNGIGSISAVTDGTLTALTNELGEAWVILSEFTWGNYIFGLFTFNWKFTNPLDGTDTCSVEQVVQIGGDQ